MKKPRRVINIALLVVAIIAVASAAIAATSGGHSSNTGNAQACNAFWTWYDSTGNTTPAGTITAYKDATTQPLIADLYNVSVGLQDRAKGLNGNKAANAAFAQNAANKAVDDCTNAGYPDPQS
jgi:hypothetical protein